jgi:ERCC4-related helicase
MFIEVFIQVEFTQSENSKIKVFLSPTNNQSAHHFAVVKTSSSLNLEQWTKLQQRSDFNGYLNWKNSKCFFATDVG